MATAVTAAMPVPQPRREICFPYGLAIAKLGDGLWPQLTGFDEPIVLDSKDTFYVLDDCDHRVRKIQ
jgi:hypothetical protein